MKLVKVLSIAIGLDLIVLLIIQFLILFLLTDANAKYDTLFDISMVSLGIIPILVSFFIKDDTISTGLNLGGVPIFLVGGWTYAYNNMQYYFSLDAAIWILILLCILDLIILIWYIKSLRKKTRRTK